MLFSTFLYIFAMYKFKKMLLTNEKLQKLFQESLNRQKKKKEREKKKKALLNLKKKKTREKIRKEEIKREKEKETQILTISRDFNVYNNKYIEREIADEDLYTTREELQEAEKRLEGKINWNIWDELVQKFRENEKRKKQNK